MPGKSLSEHRVFYSCNCYLSWYLATEYYGDEHWVWVSPSYSAHPDLRMPAPAPSSTPSAIARQLQRDIAGNDRHSGAIGRLRATGLPNGAQAKLDAGAITAAQHKEIEAIIETVELDFFRPVLFVIPNSEWVQAALVTVPVADRANPAVPEFRIERLPGSKFDMIEYRELSPW